MNASDRHLDLVPTGFTYTQCPDIGHCASTSRGLEYGSFSYISKGRKRKKRRIELTKTRVLQNENWICPIRVPGLEALRLQKAPHST